MTAKSQTEFLRGDTPAISSDWSDQGPAWLRSTGLYLLVAIGLLGSLMLFYGSYYSIHTDLAGGAMSGRLAVSLGQSFADYSIYFPPAEREWFSLAVRLSELTGLRLDLMVIAMTGVAVLGSCGLAYHIRRETVGASALFLIGSIAVLTLLPIVFKNVFGLREHLVMLGLWPYLVLRLSDPDNTKIGWKIRLLVGLMLGAALLMKYLYALVVLLVEFADAAVQRRPLALFRIENLLSGAIVALYLLLWLGIDPAQRAAIAAMVSAIDANLAPQWAIARQAAIAMALSIFLIVLSRLNRLPLRETAIGFALVVGAVAVAWIQSRWYSHHLFPVTVAYVAWWWMSHSGLRLIWQVALALVIARPVVGEFLTTERYQQSVMALDAAMEEGGISVRGKRVGMLTMHPSPFNQYLVAQQAERWNATVNNAYVAAELQAFDLPENAGKPLPPVTLKEPGRQMLHDEMLRLWEDMPPDVLILDRSTSWPLRYLKVDWNDIFSHDERFQAVLKQYRPVFRHKGETLDFTVYERAN